jgi:hypothetical protein
LQEFFPGRQFHRPDARGKALNIFWTLALDISLEASLSFTIFCLPGDTVSELQRDWQNPQATSAFT